MAFVNFIGQTLDDKYQIEKELGRGGMGTVYLATHVGTGRPVALKIIAPQFMEKLEFVERFRREARAAGRLRHPNVVNVTDFGFAATVDGNVAYLVMEYLDGVTLGEILEEEKQLPVSWTIDILEQVCSAVQEAHNQGIIHRDLKPDNIWLEPNQRGGYTVKVLDFGIAKLEENVAGEFGKAALKSSATTPTQNLRQSTTIADATQPNTIIENRSSTVISEAATIAQTGGISDLDTEAGTLVQSSDNDAEDKTAILPSGENKTALIDEKHGTRLISGQIDTGKSSLDAPTTNELTRIGAVLGTPLYMSPEQCRGERLDPSSDIYSLGVIAYQMLSGKTPFTGDFKLVMDSHKDVEPPKLEVKKVPKRLKNTIMESLAKETEKRPQTAEAFASRLRANSEGLGELMRRALVIFSQHLPKFLLLAFVTGLPYILITVLKVTFNSLQIAKVVADEGAASMAADALLGLTSFFIQIFYAAFLVGMTTWIVAQILAVPLRPISLRAAYAKAKSRWKPLTGTVTFSTLLAMLAWIIGFCIGGLLGVAVGVPLYFYVSHILSFFVGALVGIVISVALGIYISAIFMLVAPSIMMEDLRGRKALRRSINLQKRSPRTVFAASFVVYLIPVVLSTIIAFSISAIVKAVITEINEKPKASTTKKEGDFTINFGSTDDEKTTTDDEKVTTGDDKNASKEQPDENDKKALKGLAPAISAQVIEILLLPVIILITSFTSVVTALLYFKTRQAGGETMQDLLEEFEETESPRSRWQERVRERLVQSGRVTSSKKVTTG
ncbi:MAG: serine/threonine-protein kinase [Pyrinomonadaceae bacterium]